MGKQLMRFFRILLCGIGILHVGGSGAMAQASSTLAEAIDQPEWAVTTSGAAAWYFQTATTKDGVDAAKSGVIPGYQSCSMEVTRDFAAGEDYVTFWWKTELIETEICSGCLEVSLGFWVDGVLLGEIKNTVDWQQRFFPVSVGTHTLRWTYSKTGWDHPYVLRDAGYVDQMALVPAEAVPEFSLYVDSGNPPIGVAVDVTPPDKNGSGSGTTSFQRRYTAETGVTLTAPMTRETYKGLTWAGCDSTTKGGACEVLVTGDRTVKASYTSGGAIAGTVTDGVAPLEGVTVSVCPDAPNMLCSAGHLECCREYLTDASGRYAAGGLASGTHAANFSAPGYAPEYYENSTDDIRGRHVSVVTDATTTVDAILAPEGRIAGTVTAGGSPVVGTRVSATLSVGNDVVVVSKIVSTDAIGAYALAGLPEGSYSVCISHDGSDECYGKAWWSRGLGEIVKVAPGETTRVDAELKGWGGISGTVRTADGALPEEVEVWLFYSDGGSYYYDSNYYRTSTRTDSSGTYSFPRLRPGKYKLYYLVGGQYHFKMGVWYGGGAVQASAVEVVVQEGRTTEGIDVVYDLSAPRGVVSGRVTSGGTPFAGVQVELLILPYSDWWREHYPGNGWQTDDSGAYSITGVPSGSYWVTFSKWDPQGSYTYVGETYPTEVTVTEGATVTGIDVDMRKFGGIRGTVTASGKPLAGVEVWVYSANGQSSCWNDGPRPVTDESGGYAWTWCDPGRYLVQFRPPEGYASEWYDDEADTSAADLLEVTPDVTTILNVDLQPSSSNRAPKFTKGPDQAVFQSDGAQAVSKWATGISRGGADDWWQSLTFIVTNDKGALFAQQPAVAADGTLSFTPAADAKGKATVTLQLHDNGGTGNGGVDTSAAQTFTITIHPDGTPPTGSIHINDGAGYTTTAAVTLHLSATDTGGSGISMMRFANSGAPSTPWEPFQATKAWKLTSGAGTKTVWVQFKDKAGNLSDADPNKADAQSYHADIVHDPIRPIGSVLINGGAAWTNSPVVTLNLSAGDAGGSGLDAMRFANLGGPTSAWEPYQKTKSWTLSSGSGTKIVYVQFKDKAGNISDADTAKAGAQSYQDSIVYDAVRPTGFLLINNGVASTNNTAVTLNLSANDTGGSGLDSMRFANSGGTTSSWEPYQDTKIWTLIGGAGTKTVYVQFRDRAGNISDADPVKAGAQCYSETIIFSEPLRLR